MANQFNAARAETFNITHFLIRLVVGTIVLGITAALSPDFAIGGIWSLILGAVVLSVLDYLASRLLGINATPFGRGISGFLLAAAVIYVTSLLVPNFYVGFWGALIGAFIYGIVDAVIPGRGM